MFNESLSETLPENPYKILPNTKLLKCDLVPFSGLSGTAASSNAEFVTRDPTAKG